MMLRLCPRHGPLPALGARCPNPDCTLPLLRLDGGRDEPQTWRWESTASRNEIRLPSDPRRYDDEIASLARDGFTNDQIAEWFKPLGVAMAASEVEAALASTHAR